jgi:hypothetical protein
MNLSIPQNNDEFDYLSNYHFHKYSILSRVSDQTWGLLLQVVIMSNYNTVANLHTWLITTALAKSSQVDNIIL